MKCYVRIAAILQFLIGAVLLSYPVTIWVFLNTLPETALGDLAFGLLTFHTTFVVYIVSRKVRAKYLRRICNRVDSEMTEQIYRQIMGKAAEAIENGQGKAMEDYVTAQFILAYFVRIEADNLSRQRFSSGEIYRNILDRFRELQYGELMEGGEPPEYLEGMKRAMHDSVRIVEACRTEAAGRK